MKKIAASSEQTMEKQEKPAPRTRREFLKRAGYMGAMICLAGDRLFSLRRAGLGMNPGTTAAFRYRTVSVEHIPELKAWMDHLDKAGRLTANKTWRKYIGSFQYAAPAAMPNARSLIVMSTPLKISRITFDLDGKKQTVMIPSGYVDDGMALADYQNLLYAHGVAAKGDKLERARLPLKQLAVRSGLAEYGKNNITFVDGFGSYHQLLAFYSEQRLEDHWGRLKMLRLCKGCSICLKECPSRAIRTNDFVIDPEKCITLYNELPDPLPDWIPAGAHNTLIGCLKCQFTCPGNEEMAGEFWDLGEVTAAETAALLNGKPEAKLEQSLRAKLQRIGGADDLAYIARNLKLVLKARAII
jgi:epoxyqueuosine reductase